MALASDFLESQAMYDDHGIGDWPGGSGGSYFEGLGCLFKGFLALVVFAAAFNLLMAIGKWLIFDVLGGTGCLVALLAMCAISVVAVLIEFLDDVVSSVRYRWSRRHN